MPKFTATLRARPDRCSRALQYAARHIVQGALDWEDASAGGYHFTDQVMDLLIQLLPMASDVALVCRPAPGLPTVAIPLDGVIDLAGAVELDG
jgi:hypothetical protein